MLGRCAGGGAGGRLYAYACLITPYRWKITNTSLTVIRLSNSSTTPSVSFTDATPATGSTRHADASDVIDCVQGVSAAVRDTSTSTEDTWNKAVTNGLAVRGCADVVDEAGDGSLEQRLRSAARRWWAQVLRLAKNARPFIRYR